MTTMPAVAFDTLKFANRLKSVGVPPEQAEAKAEIFSEIFTVNLHQLATKQNLLRLEERIEAKLYKHDAEMNLSSINCGPEWSR